ncbi:MAG: thiamine diphosphokinase [Pseudomonadota bacterium]
MEVRAMEGKPIPFDAPVTVVGGGPFDRAALAEARALGPSVVAADQAADRLAALGERPDLVVGDLDSIGNAEAWRQSGVRVLHLTEQDTTDFEKCLYATEAPLYLAVGFTGGRIDHGMAVLHAMLARPAKRVILVGEQEAAALIPPGRRLAVVVTPGSTVSLFPLAEIRGTHSEGLRWSVDGLTLRAGRQIGTSNIADAPEIAVAVDRPGALLTVERSALAALAEALRD